MDENGRSVIDDLVRIAPHVEIMHHIPGRIRLKVRHSGLHIARDSGLKDMAMHIRGISKVTVKPLSQSVVIEYDHARIPSALWEALGKLKGAPELTVHLEKLLISLRT